MIGLLEGLLALIGLLAVIAVAAVALSLWLVEQVEPDAERHDPYREGLDTAARISAMAWEAEQAMHRAAQGNEHGRHKAGGR
jgi:hypothetical protein